MGRERKLNVGGRRVYCYTIYLAASYYAQQVGSWAGANSMLGPPYADVCCRMLTYAGGFVGRRRELDVGAAVCRRRAQRRLPSRCSVYYLLYWYKSTHTDAERAVGDAEAAGVVIALGGGGAALLDLLVQKYAY